MLAASMAAASVSSADNDVHFCTKFVDKTTEWMDDSQKFAQQLLKDTDTQFQDMVILDRESVYECKSLVHLSPGTFATMLLVQVQPGQVRS